VRPEWQAYHDAVRAHHEARVEEETANQGLARARHAAHLGLEEGANKAFVEARRVAALAIALVVERRELLKAAADRAVASGVGTVESAWDVSGAFPPRRAG
jgi:hypothetical protein